MGLTKARVERSEMPPVTHPLELREVAQLRLSGGFRASDESEEANRADLRDHQSNRTTVDADGGIWGEKRPPKVV